MDWAAVQLSPAYGFTVVGLIIVFGPLVAERLRLPGLLGLLLFGAVIDRTCSTCCRGSPASRRSAASGCCT
jgi:hypothetical protein